ncbi:1-deoxy-D-xylulose-5-phosphate reductoisomerase [Alphaproteobacteria bacterium]|nr:1-deoxy-D-xylulose-5-phosphate reductoisomerase [Alphaproteobacteria bacterium]
MNNPKSISIFGVTGSIGISTQEVILLNKNNFTVDTIVANEDVKGLIKAAILLKANLVIINSKNNFIELRDALSDYECEVQCGKEAILDASKRTVDIFVAAIIGYAGLITTYSSIGNAKTIALANKESIICAGPLLLKQAKLKKSNIIPIDSEHNTLFQILLSNKLDNISKMIITASGGPFRGFNREALDKVSPEDAIKHPIWNMGKKISIDSATLMNKGLELIEAVYLFDILPEKIEIIVHPESIIHGIIEFDDGSMSAGLSFPSMRTPISYALNYPKKIFSNVKPINLTAIKSLNFENVDEKVFRSILISRNALEKGASSVIALNAANEVAVAAFLNKKINFNNIIDIIEITINKNLSSITSDIDEIINMDTEARNIALSIIKRGNYK